MSEQYKSAEKRQGWGANFAWAVGFILLGALGIEILDGD